MRWITVLCVNLLMLSGAAVAQDKLQRIGPPLSHPWGMELLTDAEILVTTRPGQLLRINLISGEGHEITNTPEVVHAGQGGLLDVAAAGNQIFLCYAKRIGNGAATAIDRATLNGNELINRVMIFHSNNQPNSAHHFGCRLTLKGNALYASLGDRGNRYNAQKPEIHDGSVLRIGLNGAPLADNPNVRGWEGELFTMGHRNPQGMALNPMTGDIWTHEHGPQGGDEINILKGGENYGWPIISHGAEYGTGTPVSEATSRPDIADPVWVWTPSIAPSGMAFYPSDAEMFAELQGSLLVGSLKFRRLYQVMINDEGLPSAEKVLIDGTLGRIRDVLIAPDGAILLLNDAGTSDNPQGGLYRLSR